MSGDGVDQDDIAAFSAARSFQAPRLIRADRVRLRACGFRYVEFPRRPKTR